MVKLFFVGIGIFILLVVGAFAALFTPLLAGVDRNLGGPPRSPFHSPIPQSAVDTANGWIAQITPSMWLTAVLGILALLLVYTLGALVTNLARRWKERRKRYAELRWRARVMAARDLDSASTESKSASTDPKAEYETIWE